MARGKYISLEEARKYEGGIRQFIQEHPSKADAEAFEELLENMTLKKKPRGGRTSA